jgi:glycosyltransferase involved in cell wall biosynthesis
LLYSPCAAFRKLSRLFVLDGETVIFMWAAGVAISRGLPSRQSKLIVMAKRPLELVDGSQKMTLTTPIRILHLITDLDRGGAQRQLVSLVSGSPGNAYEHIVCYLRPPSDFEEELRRNGITVVSLNVSGSTKWVTAAARLARLVKSYHPDIVQTWLLDANISARLNQLIGPRIPLVTSLQNADYDPETIQAANWPRKKVAALRWVDQFTARLTSPRFVACSNFVMRSARDQLGIPDSSFDVIYNSVDPETLRCQPDEARRLRESLAIPPDGFVFLNVGRLDPQKGQEILLQAFQKVAAAAPNVFLAIAGDGPGEKRLKEMANELGIGNQILFMGRRSDVGACLEMADVFVFPSLFEGLPLALVEAMFKKLPCIVSRIDTLLEVVNDRDSGLLVAPGSVDELAAAMIQLYTDPVGRQMLGARAAEVAAERFHRRVTVPQWESLYSRIMSEQSVSLV